MLDIWNCFKEDWKSFIFYLWLVLIENHALCKTLSQYFIWLIQSLNLGIVHRLCILIIISEWFKNLVSRTTLIKFCTRYCRNESWLLKGSIFSNSILFTLGQRLIQGLRVLKLRVRCLCWSDFFKSSLINSNCINDHILVKSSAIHVYIPMICFGTQIYGRYLISSLFRVIIIEVYHCISCITLMTLIVIIFDVEGKRLTFLILIFFILNCLLTKTLLFCYHQFIT